MKLLYCYVVTWRHDRWRPTLKVFVNDKATLKQEKKLVVFLPPPYFDHVVFETGIYQKYCYVLSNSFQYILINS